MQSWTWESLSITKNANPCRWRLKRCSRKVSFIRIIFYISWNSIIYCPGPKGPDGKGLRKLIEYCSSKDPHYVVEIRPNKRSQGKELGGLFVRYITATADMWAMMLFINMSHIVEHLVFLHFQLFALCSSTKIFTWWGLYGSLLTKLSIGDIMMNSGSHLLTHGTSIIWIKVSMYFRFQHNFTKFRWHL